MHRKGVSGPISVIMFIALSIFILAFIYPVIKSLFTWFNELNPFFKFTFLFLFLMSIFVIIKEMQPQSSI